MYLEIFQQNGKKSMYFLDEDVYGDFTVAITTDVLFSIRLR